MRTIGTWRVVGAWVVVVLALAVSGCSVEVGGATTEPGDDPGAVDDGATPLDVEVVQDEALGSYLTTAGGFVLYVFLDDTQGAGGVAPVSACVGGCAAAWPPFYVEGAEADGSVASDLGSFERADGTLQATLEGWPLYTHASDPGPESPAGHGVGGVWFAAGTELPSGDEVVDTPDTGDTGDTGDAGETVGATPDVELVEDPEVGAHLVNAEWRTLYVSMNDTKGGVDEDPISGCAGGCLDTWPIFYAADLMVGEGLAAGDFGSWLREDGSWQTTWKGWPLHTFSGDAHAGDVNGHGETWIAAGTPMPAPAPAPSVGTSWDAELGSFLVDEGGYALYTSSSDTKGDTYYAPASACAGGCTATWLVFHAAEVVVPEGLDATDFGSFEREDGAWQSTYQGWPLYGYASDAAPGDTLGHGVGGKWALVTP